MMILLPATDLRHGKKRVAAVILLLQGVSCICTCKNISCSSETGAICRNGSEEPNWQI